MKDFNQWECLKCGETNTSEENETFDYCNYCRSGHHIIWDTWAYSPVFESPGFNKIAIKYVVISN